MSTGQYIGARYVPKFYQNSVDGSAQWESNVVYEPLTYVTLTNGHMYISKKQVPATVGSPVSNIEYWLDIGSYNGFIEQLQDEIDNINNVTIPAVQDEIALKQNIKDNTLATTNKTVVGAINEVNTSIRGAITTLGSKQDKTDNNLTTTSKTVVGAVNELDTAVNGLNTSVQTLTSDVTGIKKSLKKRYLIIGDSYSQNDVWQQYLNGLDSNLVIDDNIITVAYGGVGFTAKNGGYNFETMLSLVTAKLTNLGLTDNDISDVVFLGGVNDNLASSSAEENAITSCLTAYKLRFPNATYHFVMCATHGFPTTRQRLLRNIYPTWMSANGVHYPLAPFFIHSTQEFQSDMLHPNTEGMKRLARYFYNAVIKGVEMMNARFGQGGITAGSSGNTVGSNSFETNVQGNKIVLSTSGCNITFGSDVTWVDNAIVYIGDIQLSSLSILPTVDNGSAMSGVTSYLEVPVTLRNNDAALNVDSHAYIVFDYNTLNGGACRVYVTPGIGSTPYNKSIKAMTIGAFTREIYY